MQNRVSNQQISILMAKMILEGAVSLESVEAMKHIYPVAIRKNGFSIEDVVNQSGLSRSAATLRVKNLTEAGYLRKDHYRAWSLNVDRILKLNDL